MNFEETQETKPQQPAIPQFFYVERGTMPVKMTFLCHYPSKDIGVYGIYMNDHTKHPERIHILSIKDYQLDIKKVYERMLESAMDDVRAIRENMANELGK